jgi:hypothetical protein
VISIRFNLKLLLLLLLVVVVVVMVVPSQLCECRETKGLAANKIMAIEGA